jgi:hypothetical protein
MRGAAELRKLAAWYRDFAERAGDPAIWEKRLRTAERLEGEADRLDRETELRSPDGAGEHPAAPALSDSGTPYKIQ